MGALKKAPKDCRYTESHEWIRPEDKKQATMGLTDYAQSHLGDLVFLDLPTPGIQLAKSEKMGEVESVKAVSEILAPVSGKVTEVNQAAIDEPRLVNDDPYQGGWLVKIEMSSPADLDALMDKDTYDKFVRELMDKESE